MQYVSTRGRAPELEFEDVLLTGLARDGGLYVPNTWPSFTAADFKQFTSLSYAELAVRVMTPFIGDAVPAADFKRLTEDAYSRFDDPDVAPLRQINEGEWLLELFHGPTFAFKDFALQLLGRLFDYALRRRNERRTIVVATSGDTGSAAIEAFRDRENMDIFVLHPAGRVSEIQRRQMTTVLSDNVHNVAIEGSFDDCQALVKGMFNDLEFRDELGLSGVNSINWARVMAQIVYYVKAGVQLGAPGRNLAFSVPTGNFGDVYAGYVARQMGLPISQLVVATNRNDILARVLATGDYRIGTVEPTMSPSMDIQIASNFERFLFEAFDRDGGAVTALMDRLQAEGMFHIAGRALEVAREVFDAYCVGEEETLATIAAVERDAGILIDPHTAVGVAAGRALRRDHAVPMVMLATAHPAKFTQTANDRLVIPPALADLHSRPERFDVMADDLDAMKVYVRDTAAQ